ncbi:MAG: TIGR02710 family CRISPR-associated CARF protein [Planctomycetota bacterium]
MADSSNSVLVLTVGTGDVENLRATLLVPLTKSLRKGEWRKAVLLPSQITTPFAQQLRAELADVSIEIHPLPASGDENDADACFAHFDRTIGQLRTEGFSRAGILVDFTRGTKAMSAALVLAAVRHDLPQIRYISSAQRDAQGLVVPGTEVVGEVRTAMVSARKQLDQVRHFTVRGDFAAALDLLPEPAHPFVALWPGDLLQAANVLRPAVEFYAAWDRLDYALANEVKLSTAETPAEWRNLWPSADVRAWVEELAQPLPDEPDKKARRLRQLVVDLLANGERRLRDQQYEDAILRAYRVLELLGQVRLFDHGLDSGNLPPDHPAVQALRKKLQSGSGNAQLTLNRQRNLQASREHVARLLKQLGDPFSEKLLHLDKTGIKELTARNHSVLIHGFTAIGNRTACRLREIYLRLEELIVEDGGNAAHHQLTMARSLDLSGK